MIPSKRANLLYSMSKNIEQGHYYLKEVESASGVIAWSHKSRFKKAIELVGHDPSKKILDYGCGDGTFLSQIADGFREGWGMDIALDQIQDCKKRLKELTNLHFCSATEILQPFHDHAYDIVTCMETLEHCTEVTVSQILYDLLRLCIPNGKIVISVPVEIGLTFPVKLTVRKLAALRGISDYSYYESYSFTNAWKMIFASEKTNIIRPVYGEVGLEYHSHYGFNWRSLRRKISEQMIIEQTRFSPIEFLDGWFSSQVWFICTPRV